MNPHDGYARDHGLFIANSLPSGLAIDVVGTVTKLGSAVTNFAVGDKIFSLTQPHSPDQVGTQQYALIDADIATKVPNGLNDDEAATLALNPLTSFFALFAEMGLDIPPPFESEEAKNFDYAAQKILIVGGGSACGKFAVQWSKYVGIGTIIVIASKSKSEDKLKAMGATHVIDRHGSIEDIDSAVRNIVGDELIYALDCVSTTPGGQTVGARALSNTKRGFLAVLVGSSTVDETKIGEKKAGYERKRVLVNPRGVPEIGRPYWQRLPAWIKEKVVTPTPYSTIDELDADKVNEALDKYKDRRPMVKPHIHV